MPPIRDTIVVTRHADGRPHLAAMDAQSAFLPDGGGGILLQPLSPSALLDNLLREGHATLNGVDDVRIFAGCIAGRRDWPLAAAARIKGARLAQAVSHAEAEVVSVEDTPLGPRLLLRIVHEEAHRAFPGFSGAPAAVIEAALLAERAHLLPTEKIVRDLENLRRAIDETARDEEREAWNWVLEVFEVRCPGLAQAALRGRNADAAFSPPGIDLPPLPEKGR